MDKSLIAEKLTDLDFIPIVSTNGEFFSIYCEFNSFSSININNYRLAYLREKFEDNNYSAEWLTLRLKHRESITFSLPNLLGDARELQIKSKNARGDLIRLYEIQVSSSSNGPIIVDGGTYE